MLLDTDSGLTTEVDLSISCVIMDMSLSL